MSLAIVVARKEKTTFRLEDRRKRPGGNFTLQLSERKLGRKKSQIGDVHGSDLDPLSLNRTDEKSEGFRRNG
jgi:hypothetical protein